MGRKNLCMQQSLPSAASEQLEVSVKVFISYAHADQELHKQLNDHLSPLTYSGDIIIWHDQEIPAGANWEDQINTHLDEADLILL
ncbi:MAG: toll/interleukin-1 receptor domain-containing protein, partial [Chloroflexi bacterium]